MNIDNQQQNTIGGEGGAAGTTTQHPTSIITTTIAKDKNATTPPPQTVRHHGPRVDQDDVETPPEPPAPASTPLELTPEEEREKEPTEGSHRLLFQSATEDDEEDRDYYVLLGTSSQKPQADGHRDDNQPLRCDWQQQQHHTGGATVPTAPVVGMKPLSRGAAVSQYIYSQQTEQEQQVRRTAQQSGQLSLGVGTGAGASSARSTKRKDQRDFFDRAAAQRWGNLVRTMQAIVIPADDDADFGGSTGVDGSINPAGTLAAGAASTEATSASASANATAAKNKTEDGDPARSNDTKTKGHSQEEDRVHLPGEVPWSPDGDASDATNKEAHVQAAPPSQQPMMSEDHHFFFNSVHHQGAGAHPLGLQRPLASALTAELAAASSASPTGPVHGTAAAAGRLGLARDYHQEPGLTFPRHDSSSMMALEQEMWMQQQQWRLFGYTPPVLQPYAAAAAAPPPYQDGVPPDATNPNVDEQTLGMMSIACQPGSGVPLPLPSSLPFGHATQMAYFIAQQKKLRVQQNLFLQHNQRKHLEGRAAVDNHERHRSLGASPTGPQSARPGEAAPSSWAPQHHHRRRNDGCRGERPYYPFRPYQFNQQHLPPPQSGWWGGGAGNPSPDEGEAWPYAYNSHAAASSPLYRSYTQQRSLPQHQQWQGSRQQGPLRAGAKRSGHAVAQHVPPTGTTTAVVRRAAASAVTSPSALPAGNKGQRRGAPPIRILVRPVSLEAVDGDAEVSQGQPLGQPLDGAAVADTGVATKSNDEEAAAAADNNAKEADRAAADPVPDAGVAGDSDGKATGGAIAAPAAPQSPQPLSLTDPHQLVLEKAEPRVAAVCDGCAAEFISDTADTTNEVLQEGGETHEEQLPPRSTSPDDSSRKHNDHQCDHDEQPKPKPTAVVRTPYVAKASLLAVGSERVDAMSALLLEGSKELEEALHAFDSVVVDLPAPPALHAHPDAADGNGADIEAPTNAQAEAEGACAKLRAVLARQSADVVERVVRMNEEYTSSCVNLANSIRGSGGRVKKVNFNVSQAAFNGDAAQSAVSLGSMLSTASSSAAEAESPTTHSSRNRENADIVLAPRPLLARARRFYRFPIGGDVGACCDADSLNHKSGLLPPPPSQPRAASSSAAGTDQVVFPAASEEVEGAVTATASAVATTSG